MGTTPGEMLVRLNRDGLDSPWGFRLHGGMDYNSPLVVAKVVTGSAADGNLKVGDVIRRIGHTNCARIRHQEAIEVVADAGSSLDIFVTRAPSASGGFRRQPTPDQNGPASRYKPQDPNEKLPIPQNKQLADLMQKSLTLGPEARRPKAAHQATDLPLPSEPTPSTRPLTSYLPTKQSAARSARSMPPPSDPHVVSQIRNTIIRTGSQASSRQGSGRSSPGAGGMGNVIELRSPGSTAPSVGVWSPPAQHPGAQLMHLQYNSPLNVYAANNVADMVEKMSGGKVEWLNQRPQARYLDDIKQSKTYQLVQELEGNRPSPSFGYEQSSAIKTMEKALRREGIYKE